MMICLPPGALTACSGTRVQPGCFGAVLQERLEGGTDGGLVGDAEACELVEGGVVVFDGLVGVFDVERGHGSWGGVVRVGVFWRNDTTFWGDGGVSCLHGPGTEH